MAPQQYKATYAAPTNYVQTYNHVPQFQVDPGFYATTVAAYIRQKAAAVAQAQSDREIVSRLERIEAKVDRNQAFVPPPDPIVPHPPEPGIKGLASVLNRCASCHTGQSSSGGFEIFESPGKLAVLDIEAKEKIFKRTDPKHPKSMPPKGERVPAADRREIAGSILADVANAKAAIAAIEESIK